jgi:hypothetical protein
VFGKFVVFLHKSTKKSPNENPAVRGALGQEPAGVRRVKTTIMLKKGDTVRFVSAVGGGVVSRFDEKKGLVYIEDEDGFEIPVLERECVVVPKVNPSTNFPVKESGSKNTATVEPAQPGQSSGAHRATSAAFDAASALEQETLSSLLQSAQRQVELYETDGGDSLQVALAFLPVDIKKLQYCDYEAILINDSNYFLMYSVLVGEPGLQRSVAQGVLEPNMQEQLAVLTNADLNEWENIGVQALAYKIGKSFGSQPVVDRKLRIAPLKFYKLHSFTSNDYFDDKAMVYLLTSDEDAEMPEIDPVAIKKALLQKEPVPVKPVRREKTPKGSDLIEVDLHIHELVDTTNGLSNADMLQLQLDKFHAVIAENSSRKGQKIVFIHGKGEGVLRSEIMKALKTRYKTFYVQDASFREYGFGATMIVIR